MNGIGLAAGLLAQISFWALLRSLGGRSAAIAGSVLLLFTPAWWELNTFGHPTPLAFALFLTALVAWDSFLHSPGGAKRTATLVLAFALHAAAALVRADILLAGLAFPAWAWIRTRRRSALLVALILVTVAGIAVAISIRAALGWASSSASGVASLPSLFDFHARTLVKKLGVAVVGAGPALFFAVVAGVVAVIASRRQDALLLAAAVVIPGVVWWLPIEGPFRHWLVVYGFALVPVSVWLGKESPGRALALALVLVVVNQLLAAALYAPLAREYPFSYREVPGERRWSTRAPLGDWFSHHATAARAVREEAAAARWLASDDRPAILVVALSPYRLEWEVLVRHAPYRFVTDTRSEVPWIELRAAGRRYLFVESDPARVRPVLAQAFASGELSSFAVYVPRWAEPLEPYPIPAGVVRIAP